VNLRVDLIESYERRSASALSLRSVLRIGTFALPALLLLGVAVFVFNMIRVKNELNILESQWDALRPRKEQAQALRDTLLANEAILKEMQDWQRARLPVEAQLVGLMEHTPAGIQYRQLRVTHRLQLLNEQAPARFYGLTINGRAEGKLAEQSVQLLRLRLEDAAAFTGRVETVAVTEFGADLGENAQKTDRTFTIQAAYTPIVFE
jgi:hypothetical protein